MLADELLKVQKFKEQDAKFGPIRKGLRMSLVSHMKDFPDVVKNIEKFIGIEPTDPNGTASRANFIDHFIKTLSYLDESYEKLGNSTGATMVAKVNSLFSVYVERVGVESNEGKINFFPQHKEKFAMYTSEDQEMKAVIPRNTFKIIKTYIDKWYFVLLQYSINPRAKVLFHKISTIREKIQHFEFMLSKLLGPLQKDFAKELIGFMKSLKLTLLRLRKFSEAIDASNFGNLIKQLTDIAIEEGTRIYKKHNPIITYNSGPRKGYSISLQNVIDLYDNATFAVRQTMAELETKNAGASHRRDNNKNFWDVASQMTSFRDGMRSVIDEFGKAISPSDEDYKYFTHTVQAVIIPYINQSRGQINQTFTVGVQNLDTTFWKLVIKAIELGQDNNEEITEILGLTVRITQKDLDSFLHTGKGGGDEHFNLS